MRDNAARIAAEDSRRAARPAKAEEYKFGLSPEFKAPQGLEFKLNPDDPLVGQYRNFAVESGLDQAQFTKGLDLIAALRVGEAQQFATAKTAELGKLGPNAQPRVTAVTQWLTAMAGDKAADAVRVLVQAPTASTVEALETIIQKFTSQGGAAFNRSGTEQGDPTATKIPGYEKMSFEQRRHAQDQRRAGAR